MFPCRVRISSDPNESDTNRSTTTRKLPSAYLKSRQIAEDQPMDHGSNNTSNGEFVIGATKFKTVFETPPTWMLQSLERCALLICTILLHNNPRLALDAAQMLALGQMVHFVGHAVWVRHLQAALLMDQINAMHAHTSQPDLYDQLTATSIHRDMVEAMQTCLISMEHLTNGRNLYDNADAERVMHHDQATRQWHEVAASMPLICSTIGSCLLVPLPIVPDLASSNRCRVWVHRTTCDALRRISLIRRILKPYCAKTEHMQVLLDAVRSQIHHVCTRTGSALLGARTILLQQLFQVLQSGMDEHNERPDWFHAEWLTLSKWLTPLWEASLQQVEQYMHLSLQASMETFARLHRQALANPRSKWNPTTALACTVRAACLVACETRSGGSAVSLQGRSSSSSTLLTTTTTPSTASTLSSAWGQLKLSQHWNQVDHLLTPDKNPLKCVKYDWALATDDHMMQWSKAVKNRWRQQVSNLSRLLGVHSPMDPLSKLVGPQSFLNVVRRMKYLIAKRTNVSKDANDGSDTAKKREGPVANCMTALLRSDETAAERVLCILVHAHPSPLDNRVVFTMFRTELHGEHDSISQQQVEDIQSAWTHVQTADLSVLERYFVAAYESCTFDVEFVTMSPSFNAHCKSLLLALTCRTREVQSIMMNQDT